jgi:hypothetical protein
MEFLVYTYRHHMLYLAKLDAGGKQRVFKFHDETTDGRATGIY